MDGDVICTCCEKPSAKYVTLRTCSGKKLHIGIECGCAIAFSYEWKHAIKKSGEDIGDIKQFKPICPVCGSLLVEFRQRLKCTNCGRYEEGCCEGGPCNDPDPEKKSDADN